MISKTPLPRTLILMGVSGCGKTVAGHLLAPKVDGVCEDADDFHTEEAKDKMRASIPLTDEDRWPWYAKLRARIEEMRGQTPCYILACSALKHIYREKLRAGDDDSQMQFVFLDGTFELINDRMSKRHNHYMPVSLLQSQFATLERPEHAVRVDIDQSPLEIVTEILSHFTLP
ncbi:MAG: gluconate kinase [Verrucomicrobiaceae bacterium]|nr:gluconate kinase [Verrucomicrobiaceae bacterium]